MAVVGEFDFDAWAWMQRIEYWEVKNMENTILTTKDLYRTLYLHASEELEKARRQLDDLWAENQALRRALERQRYAVERRPAR